MNVFRFARDHKEIKSRFSVYVPAGKGGGFVMIDIAMTLLFPFLDFIPSAFPGIGFTGIN